MRSLGEEPREGLDLVLFASTPQLVRRGLGAGISSFIVDWEWRGKQARQRGADTEINRDGPEDLARLRRLGAPRRLCRINRMGPWSAEEVETALDAGATRILLPMVERPEELERALRRVDDRAELAILVETTNGVARAAELARLSPAAVYVGLNDLAISRRSTSLFDAVVDGTVERVREAFPSTPFGFGGVTVVGGGKPVPTRLLVGEMARLDSRFSFLRRSFRRDIQGRDWAREVERIQDLWRELLRRTPAEVAADREALARAVAAAPSPPALTLPPADPALDPDHDPGEPDR